MSERGRCMAGQAEQADVAVLQHVRIRAPVRDMAGCATFRLHRRVFEYEGSLLIRVALETDEIAGRGGSDLPRQAIRGLPGSARPMLVVAVGTLNQALIHTMAKRHVELRFLLQVTRIAKVGLRLDQQLILRCRVVCRVAIDATHLILPVE